MGASLWFGFLAWLPPVVTFWFMAMLSGRERWIGLPAIVATTVAVAFVTMGAPLGVMLWWRWRGAAIAYGAGLAIGVVPTVWVVVTVLLVAAR